MRVHCFLLVPLFETDGALCFMRRPAFVHAPRQSTPIASSDDVDITVHGLRSTSMTGYLRYACHAACHLQYFHGVSSRLIKCLGEGNSTLQRLCGCSTCTGSNAAPASAPEASAGVGPSTSLGAPFSGRCPELLPFAKLCSEEHATLLEEISRMPEAGTHAGAIPAIFRGDEDEVGGDAEDDDDIVAIMGA